MKPAKHLWTFQVGSGIHGNPTTFTASGKQYVAIVYGAGGGGIWPIYYADCLKKNHKGGGLMVFAVEMSSAQTPVTSTEVVQSEGGQYALPLFFVRLAQERFAERTGPDQD